MNCCEGLKIDIPEGAKKIVLVGNPNVGKSVFFNALTGVYVDVSNFPGTTVDVSHGRYGNDVVIDTPGVYGVSSFNDEERVARDVILYGDIILNVVDALHIERDLFLTLQIIDMGKPVIVALNMMDDVQRNGIQLDVQELGRLLGVPVIPTVAVKGEGIDEVKKNLYKAAVGKVNPKIYEMMKDYIDRVEEQSEALMIVEDDETILDKYNMEATGKREEAYKLRRQRVDEIVSRIIRKEGRGNTFRQRLGYYMLNPITGIPMLILVLYIMYKLIGVYVAGNVVDFTEGTLMQGYYEPFVRGIISKVVGEGNIIYRALAGEYGLLTLTPTYVFGLLLPLVIAFYFFMSLMEDSGYLPRIAALTDRVLSFFGLNGRAIIPLILGFGCVTMATITTRLLGTRREKVIATALLGMTIPCSAQLGVIAGMIAPLGAKYLLIYILTILLVFVITGTTLNRVLPGESSNLFIDLPPIRLPRTINVLKKTWSKTSMFIKEAAPLFALGALIITLLNETGILVVIQDLFKPFTVGMLKLPKEAATAFIMGIIRRDFGAAGLTDLTLTHAQTVVALVTITLFVPCIASIMVMFKERSKKEAISIWLGSFVSAFVVGGLLALIII
ncbi:ferrous iron transport protein B [Fonticella tunisiensis]|uniref:Ferrous iron transport protein B n=1 Tax=Fonticella tunisiensis TaxID=1096341 RepID=A0A4R7KT18_9CLOT|nr:ferrous iron transport protein B [Fonticella tunisiensis]TDT61985.1 ferrous iron transport protein B [Fonticella tunisiensis]